MPVPVAQSPQRRRTIVYIDGFNLYHGAIRSTPYLKWLDIARFSQLLRPHDDLRLIRYFSALIEGPTKVNQETYLKALSTTPLIEIVLGKFERKTLECGVQLAAQPAQSSTTRARKSGPTLILQSSCWTTHTV
jgi:hypothetical protein